MFDGWVDLVLRKWTGIVPDFTLDVTALAQAHEGTSAPLLHSNNRCSVRNLQSCLSGRLPACCPANRQISSNRFTSGCLWRTMQTQLSQQNHRRDMMRESWVFVFSIVPSTMCENIGYINYGLKLVLVCLYIAQSHYHHYADLPGNIEYISGLFSRVCA